MFITSKNPEAKLRDLLSCFLFFIADFSDKNFNQLL